MRIGIGTSLIGGAATFFDTTVNPPLITGPSGGQGAASSSVSVNEN